MPTTIKIFPGGSRIEFDKGKFDEWCVYLHKPAQRKYAPTDVEYFSALERIGLHFGNLKIYNDFLIFYHRTTGEIDPAVLQQITIIAGTYEEYAAEVDILFTLIYAGMIAEEKKAGAILKKRVKRLAMHQIFREEMPVEMAANFSKGKTWRELDIVMKSKGI